MLIILTLFCSIILVVIAFIPYWIRQGRRQAVAIRERQRLALELSQPYQQKVAADRAHQLALEKQRQERETFAHQVHTDMAKLWIDSHVLPAERYIVNAEVSSLLALPSLKRQAAPDETTTLDEPPAQDFPALPLTSIVEELPYNSLAFAFGTYRHTGDLITTTLPEALHIQITGASGQGKSFKAQGLLTQLCATNDPAHLELALLDPEGDTTLPFRGLPHVRHLADNPDRAAKELRTLTRMMDARAIGQQCALFVFIEEFLALQRMMSAHLRGQALEDFTQLVLRGRRRWIFVLTVGQTAYVQKDMREAQMQFQSILTFALRPQAARAAGMGGNNPMLNRLWAERRQGQFLLQSVGASGDEFVLAPRTNERMIKQILATSQAVPDSFPTTSQVLPDTSPLINGNTGGQHPELDCRIVERMRQMLTSNEVPSQKKIIEVCFPDMRASEAQKLYWKYLAALVAEEKKEA